MRKNKRFWVLGISALTAAVAVGAAQRGKSRTSGSLGMAVAVAAEDAWEGLRFRLSEGKLTNLGGAAGAAIARPKTTALSDAEAERILARLKAPNAQLSDTQGFALRDASLPPPRAGQTIATAFPPTENLAPPKINPEDAGALTVRRVQPQGEVPLADRVSITFSQPMVALSSQEEAAKNVPVTLTPSVAGNWRWLGTQTLIFDAGSGKRLPMATEFSLTVPAGTKSALGNALSSAQTVTFSTPAVRLIDHWPSDNDNQPQRRDPLIWLAFDQRVDPESVIQTIKIIANSQTFSVRKATDSEIASVPELRWRRDFPKERIVAVKPTELLPGDAQISVIVGPNTPSLEGPRKTQSAQNLAFRTFGPLKVRNNYGDKNPPGSGWGIEFSNPLDEEAFDPSQIKITPELPNAQIIASGNNLAISGPTKGRTTYTVTLAPTLKDAFGQTLGEARSLKFTVGPATPYLTGPPQQFLLADPAATPRIAFQSVNTPSVRVKLFSVDQSQWPAWLAYQNRGREDRGTPPGRLVLEKIVPLKTVVDAYGETSLELEPALKNNLGNVIVWWESTIRRDKNEQPDRGALWVQATKLGLGDGSRHGQAAGKCLGDADRERSERKDRERRAGQARSLRHARKALAADLRKRQCVSSGQSVGVRRRHGLAEALADRSGALVYF
jgi:alpha-2-macroglobulin